jgi:hypothetical protein
MSRTGRNYEAWRRTHVSAGLTFAQSVVALWPLNEESGTRVDIVGGNNLTDNNTVTQGAGKVGGAGAQFTAANSESLTIADNAALSIVNQSMWISLWALIDAVGANRAFCVKYNAAGNFEYAIQYTSFNTRLGFGFNGGVVYADSVGAPSLATWYHIVAYYHHSRRKVGICVNNGTIHEADHNDGTLDANGTFALGRAGSSTTSFHDGQLDAVYFGKGYDITADDIATLYNGGDGIEDIL